MRVTVDTNVLLRATISRQGPARRLVEELTLPPHSLVISEPILAELARVLAYPRLQAQHRLDDQTIAAEVALLRSLSELIVPQTPSGQGTIVADDPTDDVIVATATAGKADVLCTLDRHLLRENVVAYCRIRGIRVLRDVELLAELQG